MTRNLFRFAVLLVVLGTARMYAAGPVQAKHAQVELISQHPGTPLWGGQLLGVHFVMEKGWHIYWVNPGDSGQPPVFKWQVPLGLVVDEIQWPRPERMQSSPQLADYGYHDDVVLLVPLRVLPTWNPNALLSATIRLDAHWLICREVCIPDQAQLELSLPQRSGSDAVTAELFSRAMRLVPKPLPAGWKASAESRKDEFVLSLRTGKSFSAAQFFPLEPSQVDNAAVQKVEPSAKGARITLRKSDELLKPIAVLRGVVVLSGDEAYRVEAPVVPASK
jgi:DsbC/DsbD-like thiol-disulfide interchange protein